MENYKRKLVASSKLFSGFTTYIDITKIDTCEDVCIYFKKKLNEIFKKHNLENLICELQKTNFHIHTHSIEEILLADKNEIIYICDHCCN